MNLESFNSLSSSVLHRHSRKWPRCLQADLGFEQIPLSGVFVLGADRSQTRLMDLSLSGAVFCLEAGLKDLLQKSKLGDLFSADLRFENATEFSQILEFRVLKKSDRSILAAIESLNSNGRLRISQDLKDQMIVENTRVSPTTGLDLSFQNSWWLHGPFDFNLLVKSENSGLLEYDSLCVRWGAEGLQIFKTPGSLLPEEIYSQAWLGTGSARVALGVSWKDRAVRILKSIHEKNPSTRQTVSLALEQIGKI